MKKAMFSRKTDESGVICDLCPRNCIIANGKLGFCRVRKNIGGTLFALTHGKVTSIAVDPVEKKPLYHFHPGIMTLSLGTFGCNLRCRHCQNWELSHQGATESGEGMYDLSPEALVGLAKERDCKAIAWTYNEPGIWIEYILESARLAKKRGVSTIMVTAGLINPAPLKELLTTIDAYRLDIKGFTNNSYREIAGIEALETILASGLLAFKGGAHVEIVTNVIPGINDSEEELAGIAKWIASNLSMDTPWHLTAYHPANKLTTPGTPVATLERARSLGFKAGLRYIYVGNISGHPGQNTVCPSCLKRLITRDGFTMFENSIINSCCPYCGHRIGEYRGSSL